MTDTDTQAAPTKTKTKPMNMADKFALMDFIRSGDATLPDRMLAERASQRFGRAVNPQTVTNYRKEFGIASVAMPTREELHARIAELEAQVLTQAERIKELLQPRVVQQPA